MTRHKPMRIYIKRNDGSLSYIIYAGTPYPKDAVDPEGEWVRIPRAQWRQLKREQKAKAKQLSHDLMFEQVKKLMG